VSGAGTRVDDLWHAVERLLDRMSLQAVRVHGVRPLAARRRRELGQEVPSDLAHEERATRAAMMILPALLGHARRAYDGKMLVFKGPEVAAVYPSAARSFHDLDLLVDDARAAQAALIAGGFLEFPDPTSHYRGIHHLAPLLWPELPLKIEIHDTPKWPHGVAPPSREELFEAAVPSSSGVVGIDAPAPHHHTLLVAAHGWAHIPLRSLRDLVDVAATAVGADEDDIARAARAWQLDRMWATTHGAVRWLLYGEHRPVAVSLWARHLIDLREATVFEGHVERWLSPFWLLPAQGALPLSARRVLRDLEPGSDGTWGTKASRVTHAVRHAFMTKSEHGWVNEDAPPEVELPRPTRD
jgi:Uncharacterised nucleotidyltransferase